MMRMLHVQGEKLGYFYEKEQEKKNKEDKIRCARVNKNAVTKAKDEVRKEFAEVRMK